jgi:SHS2 domain-containing protein
MTGILNGLPGQRFDVGLFDAVSAEALTSMDKPIKAVTYNELHIEESPLGLSATVVFDV